MRKKLRILVAEDSLSIRRRFCEILSEDPELEVIGEAEDGKQAIELCEALRPDVICLDLVMPMMSGVAATEYIMAYRPTPILIVSASANRGELFKTYDALAAGAVDVLEKAPVDLAGEVWERHFKATVKLIARIKVITHMRARLDADLGVPGARYIAPAPAPAKVYPDIARSCAVVAIGASTGGPAALVQVLRDLPAALPVPILFVLHIDEPFGTAFADWLDQQTAHRVRFARSGETLESLRAHVIMAPPGRHLTVKQGRVELRNDPPRHSCRPSVDVLFESLAVDLGGQALACLLTGMGRDGAAGLLAIRRAGGLTIAQDEASSVVYGMPREAAILGAAQQILPLNRIGPAVVQALAAREKRIA